MGSPLRVLHVVVNMNRGGAETLLMNLYRNIDQSKIQFDFLTCKPGVFDNEIKGMGGKIFRIPYVSEVGHFQYVKALNKFFEENNHYQIVHSHMDKMSGIVLKAARKANIPYRISHSHSTRSEGNFLAKCYKLYAGKQIDFNATNLVACSREAAQWLFPKKIANTHIIKNGIEYEQFLFSSEIRTQVRTELKLTEDCFVIGHVGRFSEPKNHVFLIDIFAEILKNHPKTILILVGDGPKIAEIKEKASNIGLKDKVKFLGSRNDVHRLLQAFDLFMFPSLYEGLPVTLIEAQCAGLPCLISSSITKEVDLGMNLINFIPLKDQQQWLEKINIYAEKKLKRPYSFTFLSQEGYNIRDTSRKLENYYFSIKR